MSFRIIFYKTEEMAEAGNLFMRRDSEVVDEAVGEFPERFRLTRLSRGFRLEPLNGHELFIEDQLCPASIEIKNGTTFQDMEYTYKVVAEYAQAERSKMVAWLSRITAGVLGLILLLECFLVYQLPSLLAESEGRKDRVAQDRFIIRLDRTRFEVDQLKVSAGLPDETRRLVLREMERMKEYMLPWQEQLTAEDYEQFSKVLDGYDRVLKRLKEGTLFPEPVEPQPDRWFDEHFKHLLEK